MSALLRRGALLFLVAVTLNLWVEAGLTTCQPPVLRTLAPLVGATIATPFAEDGPEASAAAAAASSPHRFAQFNRYGISFSYPARWYITTKPLSSGLEPVYRFAGGNFRFRRTASDTGPCLAGIAQQRPAKGVLAYIREARGADKKLDRFPPRPRSFRLPTPRDNAACLGPGTRQYTFKDSGRAFYLWISIAPKATATAKGWLRKLVNELEIRPC